MKLDEKQHVLNVAAQLLHDNIGNRITHAVIKGMMEMLNGSIPCEPTAPLMPTWAEGESRPDGA